MDDYLSKPVQDSALAAILNRFAPQTPKVAADPHSASMRPASRVSMSATLNMEEVLENVGGDRDALQQLIDVFIHDQESLLEELESAIDSADASRVREAAHSLKGMVAFFGKSPGVEAARKLEYAGRDNALAGAETLLCDVREHLYALVDALKEFQYSGETECVLVSRSGI